MKKRIVLIAIVIIIAIIAATMIYQTYATDSSVSSSDNVHTITLSGTSEISVPAGSSKTAIYQITNTNKGVVQYGVAYKGDNVIVKAYTTSPDTSVGTIDYGENKFVKLYIKNNSTTDSIVNIEAVLGYENGGDLILPSGYNLVSSQYYDCSIFDTATECIKTMYLENKNKIVQNGPEGEEIEYQYSESVGLMNDRLGGTTSDYDAGNIRYYGATPNNYVDVGDRTSDGKVIPYRIIGVFKNMELSDGTKQDLVKVIRDDLIGEYSWDNKTNGIGSSIIDNFASNDWTDSRLMMLLNPGYDKYSTTNPFKDASGDIIYGYEGSLWWNSKSGTCYSGSSNGTKSCDFTSSGLSSDAQSKIEEVVWNLGGNYTSNIYSNVMYTSERGTTVYSDGPTEWTGKIALMYPSDYGYATDFNSCSSNLSDYETIECDNNDWLYITNTHQWQLTPVSSSSINAFAVHSSGEVVASLTVSNALGVRPVFYLDSELGIESGDGTIERPYVLG